MTSIRDLELTEARRPALSRLTLEQISAFERDGLLWLPGFFAHTEIAPLARLVEENAILKNGTVGVADSDGNFSQLFGWSGHSDDLLGAYVRIARMVEVSEDLLGGESVYHWHSKLSMKTPGSQGRWDWHQDFGSWYLEACLRPEMLTIMVAVDATSAGNGCVELVRGSHLLGRIDHGPLGQSQGADPQVVEQALAKLERVECILEPGDAVAFHANTLHASGPNNSDRPRTVLHVSYNTVRNAPARGMLNHAYVPLEKLSDDVLSRQLPAKNIDLDAVLEHRNNWGKDRQERGNIYGYTVERND